MEKSKEFIQKKKEILSKVIDKKDELPLSIWKQAIIDYISAERENELKISNLLKWLFFNVFCGKHINDLKKINKEMNKCSTVSELKTLESSIFSWTTNPTITTTKETPHTTPQTVSPQTTTQISEYSDNSEHYEIDRFKIDVSREYRELYKQLKWSEKPDLVPFACALKWYKKMKWKLWNPKYLIVVDFTKPLRKKRFYVINTETRTVENATRVWHWHNSWKWEWATSFSNTNGSEQSNLWFLTTSAKRESNSNPNYHREWLRMYWTENSNNNAASRWIFMHRGQKNWSLFSQWCFVIPDSVSEAILNKVIWGSLLFSYAKSRDYFANSNLFKTDSNWNVSIC